MTTIRRSQFALCRRRVPRRSSPRRDAAARRRSRRRRRAAAAPRSARAARLARRLLARRRQPARVPRAVDAAARRPDARREPDRDGRQDAGLRVPADRVAAGRRLLRRRCRRARRRTRSGSWARPSTRRATATTSSSRSRIRRSSSRSGSSIAAATERLALRASRRQGQRRRPAGDLPDAPDRLRDRRASRTSCRCADPRVRRRSRASRRCSPRARTARCCAYSLGNEYLKAGDPARAAEHLARAVALDPQYTAAWKLYGKALAAAGRDAEALAAYREGIAVAHARGDKQAEKEMTVFARRLERAARRSVAMRRVRRADRR